MVPDTFFLVELIINKKSYEYGPYLDLESATVVLMDLMPALANIKASGGRYSYECKVHEVALHEKKEWERLNTHLIQNKCFRRKRI